LGQTRYSMSSAVALLILSSGNLVSALYQTSVPSADTTVERRVDDYIRAEMAREQIPGLALGVYRNGEIVKVQGYGVANTKTRAPVTPETIFQSGSVGKQFTAVGIMMLVEEGKVGLEDSIAKYFPDSPASWNPIKVRHLLSHTSGLFNYNDPNKSIDLHKDYTWPQLLKIVESFPLDFQPGEQWQYSNTNYLLLGYLIEKVTGKFWADFLEERIFRPLAMKSTHVISTSTTVPSLAAGYHLEMWRYPILGVKSKLKDEDRVASVFLSTADGSLHFNVLDLARWDSALYTESLLKKSSLDQMWTIAKLNNGYPVGERYGFAWYINQRNGHRLIEHSGGTPGFRTHIARYVDDRLTVAILTNMDGLLCQPDRISHAVAAMYEPSLAPGPKPPDEPQITALVRDLVSKIASGKGLDGWSKDQIQGARAYFIAIKSLTGLELIAREQQGDRRQFIYRLIFGDLDFPCKFVFDTKDRLVSLDVAY